MNKKKILRNLALALSLMVSSTFITSCGAKSSETKSSETVNKDSNKQEEIKDSNKNKEENTNNTEASKDSTDENTESTSGEKTNKVTPKTPSNIKFVKTEEKGKKNIDVSFATEWKASKDAKFEVCINGKGKEALEEGVAKVLIKDKTTDELYTYNIETKEQLTPKYAEWIDSENILLIVGFSHGTVTKGGNLYKMNVKTGELVEVITLDEKHEVMEAKFDGSKLKLKVNAYLDDTFNESAVEEWTVDKFVPEVNELMDVKDKDGKVKYTINK